MRKFVTGCLVFGLCQLGVPAEASSLVGTTRPVWAKAQPFPSYVKQAGNTLSGTLDDEGDAVWYFDAKELVANGTHLEFGLDAETYGTMFTSRADIEAGLVYKRYFMRNDETMYFPISWSGRQYLVLQGEPGAHYRVPAALTRYEPIGENMTGSVKKATKRVLLVQSRPGTVRAKSFGATSIQSLSTNLHLEKLTYPTEEAAQTAKQQLEKSKTVAFVEYDTAIHAFGTDSYQRYQWSLNNVGQNKGMKGADIGFLAMQKRIKGKKQTTTRVAVIDTGINPSYADFAGKVRMDLGYDFINGDKSAWDDNGHGSHVSGIIAAGGNNTYGMMGIHQQASIIPIKVLDEEGAGSASGLVRGIQHAVKSGARVINMSLGGTTTSQAVEAALAAAKKKNIVIVAASGNEGRSNIAYPARSKYVLSVGATGQKDQRAAFSNYGSGLDLVAPGVSIPSYLADGELQYGSGTSMATPHVAGVASLLISLKPSLKASSVENILKKSAKDLGRKGYDTSYGAGRLNADAAVRSLP